MSSKVTSKLKNKHYRDLFVSGQIKTGIPFQLRAMRDQRKWTQEEVGKRAGLPQSTIARLENPDTAHSPNIKTLLKLASVFDVALVVRFTPFTELAHWVESIPYTVKGLSPEALAVKGFEEDMESFTMPSQSFYSETTLQKGKTIGEGVGTPEVTATTPTYTYISRSLSTGWNEPFTYQRKESPSTH